MSIHERIKKFKEFLSKYGVEVPSQPAHVASFLINSVDSLIAALGDKGFDRHRAAVGLGEIKDPKAVEPLILALNDEDDNLGYLRECSARSLGIIKDSRAIAPLIAALEVGTSGAAQWALGQITGQELGYDSKKWHEWYERIKCSGVHGGQA